MKNPHWIQVNTGRDYTVYYTYDQLEGEWIFASWATPVPMIDDTVILMMT